MIQYLADNIDQLNLALDQIAMGDRNFDRFAILLIDNVVELTLDRYAKDKKFLEQAGSSLYDPKEKGSKLLRKALGNYFNDKVEFAQNQELINETISESIKKLHLFRNSSHHQGLRHEGILHSLAVFYFRNACALLKSYHPSFWMWSGSDKISHRAMKYLGNPTSADGSRFIAAYERLDELAVSIKENLIGDLATDMNSSIDAANENIRLIAANDMDQKKRDWAIVFAQAVLENAKETTSCTEKNAKKTLKENWREAESGKEFLDWLISDHNWSTKKDPIPGWRLRHKQLTCETDYHEALKQYCKFITDTDDIRLALEELAGELDCYIEMEAKISGGK